MITFEDIRAKYQSDSDIPYYELIQTKEWIDRRKSIIIRDGNRCTNCGNVETLKMFDRFKRKESFIWFGDDQVVRVKNQDGVYVQAVLPEIIYSEKPYSMHVHHKFYILDKLPWEYEDEDLIVLCNWCHWEFHENNIVPVFKDSNSKLDKIEVTPCYRCHGAGWFPEYSHVESGICFRCKGKRYEQFIPSSSQN